MAANLESAGPSRPDLKILIASTEKTGNTWLKHLLAHCYQLPAPGVSFAFSPGEMERLGSRWVVHQHLLPEGPLIEWAEKNGAAILTTVRHPGDTLVSLYHYCCNYPGHYATDHVIARALAEDAAKREAGRADPHHVVDGALIRALLDRLYCDLNISIAWLRSGRSQPVRYEELRAAPVITLRQVAAAIAPIADDRLQTALAACELERLREENAADRKFFRRALVGEWKQVLPEEIQERLLKEEPWRSQLEFLGYHSGKMKPAEETRSDGSVPLVPILRDLYENGERPPAASWYSRGSELAPAAFAEWANAPSASDPRCGDGVPLVSNLAAFIHYRRDDVRAEFPDCFGADRLRFVSWFLRYAAFEYQLERRFLTPVVLSWLGSEDEFSFT